MVIGTQLSVFIFLKIIKDPCWYVFVKCIALFFTLLACAVHLRSLVSNRCNCEFRVSETFRMVSFLQVLMTSRDCNCTFSNRYWQLIGIPDHASEHTYFLLKSEFRAVDQGWIRWAESNISHVILLVFGLC